MEMNLEQSGQLDALPKEPVEPLATAAELCLYLIMILPDPVARVARVKDFCRLYEIAEKRPRVLVQSPAQTHDILSANEIQARSLGRIIEPKR
jgi:hypothetical protein